jgi:hypothetical protein
VEAAGDRIAVVNGDVSRLARRQARDRNGREPDTARCIVRN